MYWVDVSDETLVQIRPLKRSKILTSTVTNGGYWQGTFESKSSAGLPIKEPVKKQNSVDLLFHELSFQRPQQPPEFRGTLRIIKAYPLALQQR